MKESNNLKSQGVMSQGYGLIPKKVMKDKDLTIEAKAIYAYLQSYAGAGDTAYPSVSLMSSDLNMSERRFYKHRKQLEKKGYITIKRIRNNKGWLNNIYTLPFIPTYQNVSIQNVSEQNVCIQNDHTNNNSSINNSINNNKDKHSVLFNEWWNLYDLKRDKKKCESKYKTLLKKYSHEEMMEGTKNYINHLNNLKQRGEFVPQKRLPSTFLNNENFNDEYEQPKKAVNAEWADF